MEYIFEFILELILEGSIEASRSRKIPRCIRYMLVAIISLFYIFAVGLIIFAGIVSLKVSIILGIFFILLGLFIFIVCIIKFKQMYLSKTNKR